MAFIEKKDPLVLNIRLTTKGRELLSQGLLNFKYYAVGDSEIDYNFNRVSGVDPFNSNILRPTDRSPQQLSFITKNMDGDEYNEITAVPSTPTIIENHVQPIGFFNENVTEFLTDSDHVKQPDVMVIISGVTGGSRVFLNQAPTYQANPNEPEISDILMIKWTNPLGISTTGYTVNADNPTPYIFYKIQNIISGSLNTNDLYIELDRNLPNFTGITGGSNSIVAGAFIFYNYINFTGQTTYSSDYVEDAVIAFLQNCQCPTITFPFWNLSLIYTENIVGVNPNKDKPFGQYNSKGYGGFVSYIQNQAPVYKKLGVIHYTNSSVSNTYGEGFYGDPNNYEDVTPIDKIPRLNIPTIMWHKSTGNTLGLSLRATGRLKYLTGVTKSLNIRYYDLADTWGNVVGKVFYGLKIFVIEDQELLFAMSYKSNRSWTLPDYGFDINANVTFGCPDCVLTYTIDGIPPSTIGGTDGQIIISGITNVTGDPLADQLLLDIRWNGVQVFSNPITGDTIITNADTLNGFKLRSLTYDIKLIDLGAPDCVRVSGYTLGIPPSELNIININSTYSNLNPYFHIDAYNGNPVRIRFYSNNDDSIGYPFGTAYVTIAPTGTTNTTLNARTDGGTDGNNALTQWVQVPPTGYLEVTNLTFLEPYAIFVRDATGNTFTDIMQTNAINSQVWTYYVAVGSPFVSNNSDIVLTSGSDGGGQYVVVSNYLTSSFDPTKNPIVGNIQMAVHGIANEPVNWINTPNDGAPFKIYYNDSGNLTVTIREQLDYITTYQIRAFGTFIG